MVKVTMQILARTVMRKCHTDEVTVPLVVLVGKCGRDVQFNQEDYICREFLENCCKAQEQGKTLQYAWFLLSIMLVAWELPEDIQFLRIAQEFLEATKYASLWETRDAQRIRDNRIFWVVI